VAEDVFDPPTGIPLHDTFNGVIAVLDPEEMEMGFVDWVSSIAKLTAGEVVAIDGRRELRRGTGRRMIGEYPTLSAKANTR